MNEENSYASPKLHLVYVTMLLIFGGAVLAANFTAFGTNYVTMVGGLLGAAGIYTGGHVTSHWVMTNKLASTPIPESNETEDEGSMGYLHPHKDPGAET